MHTNPFIDSIRALAHDHVALRDGDQQITASELFNQSRALARWLDNQGVKQGDIVLLVLKPDVRFLRLMYAQMMLGTVVVIVDPEMGRANFREKVRQLKPKQAFVDSRLVLLNEHPIAKYLLLKCNHRLPDVPPMPDTRLFTVGMWLPIFQRHTHVPDKAPHSAEMVHFTPVDLDLDFLVTYTSGTLTQPKGVVHTYRSLVESLGLLGEHLGALLHDADGSEQGRKSIATHLPHFVLLGIHAGLEVHLWDNDWSAERKLDYIDQHQIGMLFGPPSDFLPMMRHCEANHRTMPACLGLIMLGSAPVYAAFLQKMTAVTCPTTRVMSLYGMTEHLMACHVDAREKLLFDGRGDLVGKPFQGVRLSIAPDGEVHLESRQLFDRYLDLHAATLPHPTGDLGYLTTDGSLVLTGRKKDMLIRGNFNLYPGLYEPVINRLPGVVESAIVGVYDPARADELVVLVLETDRPITEKSIRAALASGPYSIDRHALPDHVVFRQLPRSGRQKKVNRNVLRAEIKQLLAPSANFNPRSAPYVQP